MSDDNAIKDLYVWVHPDYRPVSLRLRRKWKKAIVDISKNPDAGLMRTKFDDDPETWSIRNLDKKARKLLGDRYQVWTEGDFIEPEKEGQLVTMKNIFNFNGEVIENMHFYGLEPMMCVNKQLIKFSEYSPKIAEKFYLRGYSPNMSS